MACEVCNDSGTYPVVNRRGQTLYEIICPECRGQGMTIYPGPMTSKPAAPDAARAPVPSTNQRF